MASLLAKKLSTYLTGAELSAKAGFFPSAKYGEADGGEYVAEVAFKNEYGSPLDHIPPRPFFRPAVAENKKSWSEIVRLTIKRGGSVEDAMEAVGLQMQGDIRDALDDVTTPELSEMTLRLRQERGNSSTKPLNDTGYMRSQLTSTVSK